jgi:hypothetical protein
MSSWQRGATPFQVENIVNRLGYKLERSGLIMSSLGIIVTVWGILIELIIRADFGYVIIALGALSTAQGGILKWVFKKDKDPKNQTKQKSTLATS